MKSTVRSVFGLIAVTLCFAITHGCSPQVANDPGKESRSGADSGVENKSETTKTAPRSSGHESLAPGEKHNETNSKSADGKPKRSGIKRVTLGNAPTVSSPRTTNSVVTSSELTDRLLDVVDEAASYGPTLVIWCFDETSSATDFVRPITERIKMHFENREEQKHPLLHAVYGFSDKVRTLTDQPTNDPQELGSALAKLTVSSADKENGLTAVSQAYGDLRKYKQRLRHQVLVVVVSDEAPSDRERLDELVELLASDETPVYAIGKPAPFGRATVEIVGSKEKSLTYGPETAALERIESDYWLDTGGMETIDSGFGPWAYERLCRRTQGRFLAQHPEGSAYASRFIRSWPTLSVSFPQNTMSGYLPDYGSEKEYLAALESNAAKRALHDAASLPRTRFTVLERVVIKSGNEAAMARDISRFQQKIAASSRPVTQLFEVIKAGQSDRDALDSKRWQAGYDLALARAAANYVRLEGANAMLASAKNGMRFSDSNNNAWLLEPSAEISTGGANRRTAETATNLLLGLVKNHADTPWAYIASQELKSPMGWKWTEMRQ